MFGFCPTTSNSRRLMTLATLTLAVLSIGSIASAQSAKEMLPTRTHTESKWKKVWKWSAAALVAGSAMDVASSYGYQEANPLLQGSGGHLNARGTGIKFGILAGSLLGQHYLLKNKPELEKPLAITNFAIGATYGTIAVRNWRVR